MIKTVEEFYVLRRNLDGAVIASWPSEQQAIGYWRANQVTYTEDTCNIHRYALTSVGIIEPTPLKWEPLKKLKAAQDAKETLT